MQHQRRQVLMATSGGLIAGLSGCLRLTGNGSGSDGNASENTFDVRQFHFHTLGTNPERLLEESELAINAEESDAEAIAGSWSGAADIMTSQTCAKYVVEILENGSPIESTGERILIYNYRYALRQTDETLFVTSHPSVDDSWDISLKLLYPNGEYTLSPVNRLPEGAFEFDLAGSDVEAGRYQWSFEITPPDSFTINIGTFNEDTLVSVDPDSSGGFPSRAEAIDTVSALTTESAIAVESPTDTGGEQLRLDGGGHNGGSLNDFDYGRELSADVAMTSDPAIEFGSQTNRQLRVRNLTTDQQLVFEPA